MPVDPSWIEHYHDELDAAWLYRALASIERDARRRDIFERLAKVEDAHVERWRELFRLAGAELPDHQTSRRTRLLAWAAARFGTPAILPLVVAEETREVGAYLRMSMGSSGYLAAKSEAEMSARQVAMEREEIRLMPDLEEDELALIYEAKGLSPARARETARTLMRDPERALITKVQEELRIQEPAVTPLADGIVTGTATALGACIPLLPFLVLSDQAAIWASLTVSMLAHFGVGAARSVFTGRGIWASGRDMFLVGFGVAGVGYIIGDLLVRF